MHPLCHDILHLIHCQIEKGPFDFFCFSHNTRYPIFIYTLKLTKKQEKQEKSLHKKRENQDFAGKRQSCGIICIFIPYFHPFSSFLRLLFPGISDQDAHRSRWFCHLLLGKLGERGMYNRVPFSAAAKNPGSDQKPHFFRNPKQKGRRFLWSSIS